MHAGAHTAESHRLIDRGRPTASRGHKPSGIYAEPGSSVKGCLGRPAVGVEAAGAPDWQGSDQRRARPGRSRLLRVNHSAPQMLITE